eukprot:COSAG05_NODE_13301_length_435_cov_0.583333_2_plen_24_part_01
MAKRGREEHCLLIVLRNHHPPVVF